MKDESNEIEPEEITVHVNEPFNDAIKHQDIAAGYQQKRSIDGFPKKSQPWVKWFVICYWLFSEEAS
ncbi:hypothetical protein SAMN05428981_11343 [Bacillus sp. OV194]|nr:hypothetical protein SAMN05428981_11343 [Bacillus sp. OV194]